MFTIIKKYFYNKWFSEKEIFLEQEVQKLRYEINALKFEKNILEIKLDHQHLNSTQLIHTINGIPWFPGIDFVDIDDNGHPPHFLKDMGAEERERAIARLASIYDDNLFQEIFKYIVNVLGNQSFYKSDEKNMKNARFAMLGVKAFYEIFRDAKNEYLNMRNRDDSFDPLSPMPE